MSFDPGHVWQSMDLFARLLVLALITMATSLAVFVERLWAYAEIRRQSQAYGGEVQTLLLRGDLEALVEAARPYRESPLATLLSAGVKTYLNARAKPSRKVEPVELARRELARRSEAIAADIRRGFGVLASVGSVAPLVGLLGTVLGIVAAFQNWWR